MALADNKSSFLPPAVIRKMANDLSFLPTWIAEPSDIVIVDSVERAEIFRDSIYNKVKKKVGEGVCFASFKEPFKNVCSRLSIDVDNAELAPWGWDGYIKRKFEKWGVPQSMLPTDEELEGIRNLSSRRVAVKMMPLVADAIGRDFCVGESFVITSLEEFFPLAEKYEGVMMKMPWSSSGKGLNYCYSTNITEKVKGWINNVIEKQGCCIVEPLYNKFGDYALEFKVSEGKVSFLGYSKFDTANQGTYQGNVLMTDKEIEDYMCYILGVDVDKIRTVRKVVEENVRNLIAPYYNGVLGVDMMIVRDYEKGDFLHPCVEVNLRNNMGILAHELKSRWITNAERFDIHYNNFIPNDKELEYIPLVPEHDKSKYTARVYLQDKNWFDNVIFG